MNLKSLQCAGYRFILSFTRHFTQGNLQGLDHNDSLAFITEKDCTDWVRDVNACNAKGSVDYKVVSFSIKSC